MWDIEYLLSNSITSPELWNVTTIMMTSLKHYPKWCGAAWLRSLCMCKFVFVCMWKRAKTHSRCLALVIKFEEDGLVFSAHHLPPPIPVSCWNRKWVLGPISAPVLCLWLSQHTVVVCLSVKGTRMLLHVCSSTRPEPFIFCTASLAVSWDIFLYALKGIVHSYDTLKSFSFCV